MTEQWQNVSLYVGGLSSAETDESLRAMCAGYGRIVSARVIVDRATGDCRGFGFVEFATCHTACRALRGLGGPVNWAQDQSSARELFVAIDSDCQLRVTVSVNGTARDVLDEIDDIDDGIAADGRQRRLAYNDRHLDHADRLGADVGVSDGDLLQLVWLPDQPSFHLLESHASIFDDQYHYRFLDMPPDDDGQERYRGGYYYRRPIGSMRYALKIKGKYDNGDDTWLGDMGQGNGGEWPVAYHGTHERHIQPIVGDQRLRLDCGKRFAFGPGIYCTPDPRTALYYADEYRDHRGRRCKMVLQLRVDPDNIRIIPANHPKIRKLRHGPYWILPQDDHLRICAVCIFPL